MVDVHLARTLRLRGGTGSSRPYKGCITMDLSILLSLIIPTIAVLLLVIGTIWARWVQSESPSRAPRPCTWSDEERRMERGSDSRDVRRISTVSVHVVYWPSRARSNFVRVVRRSIRIGLRWR